MIRHKATKAIAAGAALSISLIALEPASAGNAPGASSSESPYLVRSQNGVVTKAILTVGDTPTGSTERMVGIPDGLGAIDNGDDSFTVLMNHELRPEQGRVRDHGATGAFVSKYVVDKETLEVTAGDDLIKTVNMWNGSGHVPSAAPVAFNRFCSADLAEPAAYYNPESGLGYDAGRIFTNGEEAGNEGRAFAHVATGPDAGQSYELAHVGNMSFENVVSRPVADDKTVTVLTDDSTPGQVYVYVGDKRASGNPAEMAGLVGGNLFGVKAEGLPVTGALGAEDAVTSFPDDATFAFGGVPLGDVSALTGAGLETVSRANGVTQWARPEDGAWTPDGSSFYFVTTASFTQHSRVWRLDFDDPTDPAQGGTVTMAYEGPSGPDGGPKMMDNITVNRRGQVLIQEDPGNQSYVAGVWQYDAGSDRIRRVASHDPARFTPGAAGFMTQDEESSGIIPLDDILGRGWYLADSQVHLGHPDPELVEHGQLLVIHVPPGQSVR
jgi:hypothetical protein